MIKGITSHLQLYFILNIINVDVDGNTILNNNFLFMLLDIQRVGK